ncbi:hypothetical protein DM860_005426 [Cuscuta australis]|uniref:Uncharacterized protein n=1 Tax=Cuscuta australis TaxID=267555 RepID=A0A328E0Q9_9ASTE|nr:hypothetical protein DM860_005426 [Cuscuta australis]
MNSNSIGLGIVLPAEKHDDAAPEDVKLRLVLLRHAHAPLPEAAFPVTLRC